MMRPPFNFPHASTGPDVLQRLNSLSPRQQEICAGMVRGQASSTIAAHLGISINTVKTHRRHILRRMGVNSVIQLTVLLLNHQSRASLPASGPGADDDALTAAMEAASTSHPAEDLDLLTGLPHIEHLRLALSTQLRKSSETAGGVIAEVRIGGLPEINLSHGRRLVDTLLRDTGIALRCLISRHSGWCVARRAGADFVLLAPGSILADKVARALQNAVHDTLISNGVQPLVRLPCAAARYTGSQTFREILARLDIALQHSERHGFSCIYLADSPVDGKQTVEGENRPA